MSGQSRPYRLLMVDGPFAKIDVVRDLVRDAPVELDLAAVTSPEEAKTNATGADAVLVTTNPLSRELIGALPESVRIIGRAGVGLDTIDLEAARERGMAVYYTPDYCIEEVANHTLALILALNRKIIQANTLARRDWGAWREMAPILPLDEQTAGIVGFGRIGRALARRLEPLVREIVVFDPFVQAAGPARSVSLEELLSESDIATLHLPLTAETNALLGRRELALMKSSAYLVNVSRGALLNEAALVEALTEGRLAGAGLDVLEHEPASPDDPLLNAPNVIITPHSAWYSTAAEQRAWTMTVAGVVAYLEGRVPESGALPVLPRKLARTDR